VLFGIYVAVKDIRRRRRALLALDQAIRAELQAKGFVSRDVSCYEHATGWCIRVFNPTRIDMPEKNHDTILGDVGRILLGVSASYADRIFVEFSQLFPKEDADILCHILLRYRRR
jgi:hypothetical protein